MKRPLKIAAFVCLAICYKNANAASAVTLSDVEEALQIKIKHIEASTALRQVAATKNKIYELESSEFQTFATDSLRVKNEYSLALQQLRLGDFKRAVELADKALSSKSFADDKIRLAFVKIKFEGLRKSGDLSAAGRYCGVELNQFSGNKIQSEMGEFSLSCAQTIVNAARFQFSSFEALSGSEIDSIVYSSWNKRIEPNRLARNLFFASVLGQYKRIDEAIALLEQDVKAAPTAAPELAKSYLMLSELLAKKGEFSSAKDILQYLARLNKKSRLIDREISIDESTKILATLSLARLLKDNDDAATASQMYDLALASELLKNDIDANLESAVVDYTLGKTERSLERFSKIKDSLLLSRVENTNFGIPEFIEVLSKRSSDESQALANRQIAFVQQDLVYLDKVNNRLGVMGQAELIRSGRAIAALQDIYQTRSPYSERLALFSGVVDKSAADIRSQRLDTLELLQVALKSEDVFARKERGQLQDLFHQFSELKSLYNSLNQLSLLEWSEKERTNGSYTEYLASLDRKMTTIFEDEFAKEVFNRRQTSSNGAFWKNVEKAKQTLEDNRKLFIRLESARVARDLKRIPKTDDEIILRNELQQQNIEIAELFREMALFRLQSKNVLSADDNAYSRRRMRLAANVAVEFKNIHMRALARNELVDAGVKKRLGAAWDHFITLLGGLEKEFTLTLDSVDAKKKRVVEEVLIAIRAQDLQERDLEFVKKRLSTQYQTLLPNIVSSVRLQAETYKGRLTIAANQGRREQYEAQKKELEGMRDAAEVRELWLKSLEASVDDGLLR